MSRVLDLTSEPSNKEVGEIHTACRQFYASNNAIDAFAEMLAASDILGVSVDYRAKDLMRVNAELVKTAIGKACHLMDLMDQHIADLEKRS